MSFFRPRTSLSSNPNLTESFARLIKRLPDQFGKIAIENTTLQQHLNKIATNFQSSSDLIQQMDALFKKIPQTNENAVLFMQIMAGFLHAFKKDFQVNLMKDSVLEVYLDQATQLLEHKTTDMMTRMPVQAMKLGMTMANYTSAIPDVVKEVKKYEALLTRFKPSMDYMGLNPFESRALEVKSGKPHQTFETMLNQLDLTKQTAKTTPENHRIHLIWMGSIPQQYFDNIKSWKEKNPAYEVVLYIDRGDKDAEFLAWCKTQKIKLVMIDEVISSHPAYKYFVYERSLPNYGAASDIARYILLQFYGGLYFDVPDIFCKKALPELKEDILCHKQGVYSNNDCLAVVTSKGKAVFEAALNTISTQYQTGYAGLGQKSKMTMEPI